MPMRTGVRDPLTTFDFEQEMALQRLLGPAKPVTMRMNGSGWVTATNIEFLRRVFHSKTKEERIWTVTITGDPRQAARNDWFGGPARVSNHELYNTAEQALNGYYAVSTFVPKPDGNGNVKCYRRIANFARTHVIVCDDIGLGASAKIGPDKIKLEPSFVLETSPDNFQVGYILREPLERREIADVLQDALIFQGLGAERDPGQKNVTRYMRLPDGVNAKSEYVDRLGHPFPHTLWVWQPGATYNYQDIIHAYDLTLERIQLRQNFNQAALLKAEDDPYVAKLAELGLIIGEPIDKGAAGTWVPVRCPNVEKHTEHDETGSAYCVGGGYKCHHGTCQDVGFSDLQSYLALHYDVSQDEIAEMDTKLKQLRANKQNLLDSYSKAFLEVASRREYLF